MRDEDKANDLLIHELSGLGRQIAQSENAKTPGAHLKWVGRGLRIGEILLDMRYVTSSQLDTSLQKQRESEMHRHKRLGEIMVESGVITEEDMHSALEVQEFRRKRYHRSTMH
jgi:hypothetical protein